MRDVFPVVDTMRFTHDALRYLLQPLFPPPSIMFSDMANCKKLPVKTLFSTHY